MPIKVIGMIGVARPGDAATVHVIDGGVSPAYLVEFSQAHDRAGFDLVLVGYTSTSADGWTVATHAAANTENLGIYGARDPILKYVGTGAFLALVVTGPWVARGHLSLIWKRVTGEVGPEVDEKEMPES